jgi:hypothetical protein
MQPTDASALPTIALETYGEISVEDALAIRQEVMACYQALRKCPLPAVVNLGLFDTLAQWRAYATRCREEMGVVTAGEEGFLATHDAWEGVPRLSVCLERLQGQAVLLQQGALHQVVAHSILHGRPDYYRFQVPKALLEATAALGWEQQVLLQVLYFVSIAVKGREAAALLVENGFVQDQIALAFYQLEKRPDDVELWKMARWEPRARVLYLAAQLKPLLYLRPLLPYAPALESAGRIMLAHLPQEDVERIETLVTDLVEHCSGDTHRDVSLGLVMALNRL